MVYADIRGKDFAKGAHVGGMKVGFRSKYEAKDPTQVYADAQKLLASFIPGTNTGVPVSGTPVSSGNFQVDRNQALLDRTRQRAAYFGGNPVEAPGPSLLSRIFDVLSRGQYAVMGGINEAADAQARGDNPLAALDDFAIGAVRGLKGETKDSFSGVLERAGVDNPIIKGVGGLAGDILLDPSTYFGVGLIKAGGAGAIKGAKAAGASRGLNIVDGLGKSSESLKLRKQINTAIAEARKAAGPKGLNAKGVEKVRQQVQEAFVEKTAFEAGQKAAIEGVGRIQLKFAGKVIVDTPKGYEWASTALSPLKHVPGVQAANKAFRTAAHYGPLNESRRFWESRGIGELTDWEDAWRNTTKGLTKDEATQITHAIEDGLATGLGVSKNGVDMDNIAKMAQDWFNQFGDTEISARILAPEQKRANYVYHMFRGGDPKQVEQFKRARRITPVGPNKPSFAHTRKIPTLRDAINQGLDPVTDIRDVVAARAAKHYRAIHRANFVREAAEQFGMRMGLEKGSKLTKTQQNVAKKLNLVPLKNADLLDEEVRFPQEIANIIDGIEEIYQKPEEVRKLMNHFDQVTRMWKTGATVVNPGHHFRNVIGDIFNGYLGGVKDPIRYAQAWRVIHRDPTKKIKIANQLFTGDELYRFYVESGLKAGFFPNEIGKFASDNVAGKALDGIRKFSEQREDWTRAAHMIDVLVKSAAGKKWKKTARFVELEKLARKTRTEVVKFKFDYGDLTEFERKVMKRWMPFYTWQRKNVPLQLETLVSRPGRIAAVPKSINAFDRILGRDPEDDPKLWDRIPHWIKETNPVLLRGGEEPIFASLGLPVQDLAQFGNESGDPSVMALIKHQLGNLHPGIRAPVELASGRQLYGDIPVAGNGQYAANQLPVGRLLYNQFLRDGKRDPRQQQLAWVNWLTGAGLQQANFQRQAGELRRQGDLPEKVLREARKRLKEQAGLENQWGY